MDNSLFIGNGLNRCCCKNIAWNELLLNIAQKYNVEHNPDIPFSLGFENIVNQVLIKSVNPTPNIYRKIKNEIIETLRQAALSSDILHKKVASRATVSIITTNYDYLLEKALDENFNEEIPLTQVSNFPNRYNLRKRTAVSGKNIYHIHGELCNVDSICLGYEHYAGTLQNLRPELNTNKSGSKKIDIPAIKKVLDGSIESTKVWAEKFFTDNISFIGFGLSDCEIDLWWLITYRASLYYSNRAEIKSYINNQIIYYDISTEKNEYLSTILPTMHIKYEHIPIKNKNEDTYKTAYEKLFDRLFE